MRAAYVRPEGDHVQTGVTGRQQAAFQPGVDDLQIRRLAELLGVNTLADGQQAGGGIRAPARVAAVLPCPQIMGTGMRDHRIGQRARLIVVQ